MERRRMKKTKRRRRMKRKRRMKRSLKSMMRRMKRRRLADDQWWSDGAELAVFGVPGAPRCQTAQTPAVRSCLRMLRDLYQPSTGCTAQLATVRSALVLLEHRGEEGAWDR